MGNAQQRGVNIDSAVEPEDKNVMTHVPMRSQRETRARYQTYKIVYEIMCMYGSDVKQHNVVLKN